MAAPDPDLGRKIRALLASPWDLQGMAATEVEAVFVGVTPFLEGSLHADGARLSGEEIHTLLFALRLRIYEHPDIAAATPDLDVARAGLAAIEAGDPTVGQLPHSDPRWLYWSGLRRLIAIPDVVRCLLDPPQIGESGEEVAETIREAVRCIGHFGLTDAEFERLLTPVARRYWTGQVPNTSWYELIPAALQEAVTVMMRAHLGQTLERPAGWLHPSHTMLRMGIWSTPSQRVHETAVALARAAEFGGIRHLLERGPGVAAGLVVPLLEPGEREEVIFALMLGAIADPERCVPPVRQLVDFMAAEHDAGAPHAERAAIRACLKSVIGLLRSLESAEAITPRHPLIGLADHVSTVYDLREPTSAESAAVRCLGDPTQLRSLGALAAVPALKMTVYLAIQDHVRPRRLANLLRGLLDLRPSGLLNIVDFIAALDGLTKALRSDGAGLIAPAGTGGASNPRAEVGELIPLVEQHRDGLVVSAVEALALVNSTPSLVAGQETARMRGDQLPVLLGHAVTQTALGRIEVERLREAVNGLVQVYLSGMAPPDWRGEVARAMRLVSRGLHELQVPTFSADIPDLSPPLPFAARRLLFGFGTPGTYASQLEVAATAVQRIDHLPGPAALADGKAILIARVLMALRYPGVPAYGLEEEIAATLKILDIDSRITGDSTADLAAKWAELTLTRDVLRLAALSNMLDDVSGVEEIALRVAEAVALRDPRTTADEIAIWIYQRPSAIAEVASLRLPEVLAAITEAAVGPLQHRYGEIVTALIRATWQVDRNDSAWLAWTDAVTGPRTNASTPAASPHQAALGATRHAIALLRIPTPGDGTAGRVVQPAAARALRTLAERQLSFYAAPEPTRSAALSGPYDERLICGLALILAREDSAHPHSREHAQDLLLHIGNEAINAGHPDHQQRLQIVIRGFVLLGHLVESGVAPGVQPPLADLIRQVVNATTSLMQGNQIVVAPDVQSAIAALDEGGHGLGG